MSNVFKAWKNLSVYTEFNAFIWWLSEGGNNYLRSQDKLLHVLIDTSIYWTSVFFKNYVDIWAEK